MYTTSALYKTAIKQNNREFKYKVTIGDTILTNSDIKDMNIKSMMQDNNGFTLGTVCSKTLDFTLINTNDITKVINEALDVVVEVGIKLSDNTFEYIPMGKYYITKVDKGDFLTKYTVNDGMLKLERAYFSDLTYPTTISQVMAEISTKTGISFAYTLPNYTIPTKPIGYTYRQVVSFIAQLCGANAVINRLGQLTFVTPNGTTESLDITDYNKSTQNTQTFKIAKISCQLPSGTILTRGTLTVDSMELQIKNPFMTSAIMDTLYTQLNNMTYVGFNCNTYGDLSYDLGDVIQITDRKNNTINALILQQDYSFKGSLTSVISAKGQTKTQNTFNSQGETTQKVDKLVADVIQANDILATKVTANEVNADKIIANTISGGTATLQTILTSYITGATGQFLKLTGDNFTANNGVIKNAMIDTITANKITSGTIDTQFVDIVSSDGNFIIADNTMQIVDGNLNTRVQIGKDAQNDYSINVWDVNKKIMFSSNGITADAIKSEIIRNDMVSPTANISGSKLNIASVITSINEDGTTTLKGNKVFLDAEAQTLDLAFNSLKTTTNTNGSNIQTLTTNLGIEQGRINTLVGETHIIKDGQTVTLKDAYSSTVQKVDSIDTRVTTTETNFANMDIGGRNLIRNSDWQKMTNGAFDNWITNVPEGSISLDSNKMFDNKPSLKINGTTTTNVFVGMYKVDGYTVPFKPNTEYTISVYYFVDSLTNFTKPFRIYNFTKPSNTSFIKSIVPSGTESATQTVAKVGVWTKYIYTFRTPQTDTGWGYTTGSINFGLNFANVIGNGVIWLADFKVEEGNKATAWIPANEDLETRVSTAEQLITPTSITQRISTAINNGTASIQTTAMILDNTGLTIDNGMLKVKNASGKSVLSADTGGNLTLEGVFQQYDASTGYQSVKIANNKINIYDYATNGDLVGSFLSVHDAPKGYGRAVLLGDTGNPLDIGMYINSTLNTYNKYITLSDNNDCPAPIYIHQQTSFKANTRWNGGTRDSGYITYNANGFVLASNGDYSTEGVKIGNFTGNATTYNSVATFGTDKITFDKLLQVNGGACNIWAGGYSFGGISSGLGANTRIWCNQDRSANIELVSVSGTTSHTNVLSGYDGTNIYAHDTLAMSISNGTTTSVAETFRAGGVYTDIIPQEIASIRSKLVTINGNINGVSIYASLGAISLNSPQTTCSGSFYASGSINCSGTKYRVVQTETCGIVGMSAFETAEPMFGDDGDSVLDENGETYIYITPAFSECINKSNYRVFVSKYGQGDLWVEERNENYFVVKGTPNLHFSYEIKAKQRDYESYRLEEQPQLQDLIKKKDNTTSSGLIPIEETSISDEDLLNLIN